VKEETKWLGSLGIVAVVLALIVAYAHKSAAKALKEQTSGLAGAQQKIASSTAGYVAGALSSPTGQKVTGAALKGADVVAAPIQTVRRGDWLGAGGDVLTGGAVSIGRTVYGVF
jgi:hypothetical protein